MGINIAGDVLSDAYSNRSLVLGSLPKLQNIDLFSSIIEDLDMAMEYAESNYIKASLHPQFKSGCRLQRTYRVVFLKIDCSFLLPSFISLRNLGNNKKWKINLACCIMSLIVLVEYYGAPIVNLLRSTLFR
jgi:hypothetical protein